MPLKKKQKRMAAATDRQTRSKSPESKVGSLTQEAPEIEATQEATHWATQEAIHEATHWVTQEAIQEAIMEATEVDLQEIIEEGCVEEGVI